MITLHNISSYLKWMVHARTKQGHRVHSPFLFSLITNSLYKPVPAEELKLISDYRKGLLADKNKLTISDFGSGSSIDKTDSRRVCDIARHSSTSPRDGRLLYNLAASMRCKNILELGTNLGLGTLYLAAAAKDGTVTTIEGCPNLSEYSSFKFQGLNVDNIHQVRGEFDSTLPKVLQEIPTLDFVFFDGNHRREPTISYFNQCLLKSHNDSVFVFDDIHKDTEMEMAWSEIVENEKVTLSIDFYAMGVVFFRRQLSRQTYCLRY